MGGCQNCAAKPGCDDQKGEMFAAIDRELARLYPSARWGEPDDHARLGGGIGEEAGHALADELAAALKAATFFLAGAEHEYCDYLYILCMGREPCAVQLRDGAVPLPEELEPGTKLQELYLRVCLSDMAPFAAVQQVAFELEVLEDLALLITEAPRAGVYDAPLLHRMQRLVATLPTYGLVHLDFGDISAPPSGFDPGEYEQLYGTPPATANYFFYPQPPTMPATTLIKRGRS